MEEKLAHAVVRDENIGESVVIIVREGDAERASFDRGDSGPLADVFECAIAAVAIEDIRGRGEFGRRTVGLPLASANLAVLRVPEHVSRDEQVQVAVVVVIEEARGATPASR